MYVKVSDRSLVIVTQRMPKLLNNYIAGCTMVARISEGDLLAYGAASIRTSSFAKRCICSLSVAINVSSGRPS